MYMNLIRNVFVFPKSLVKHIAIVLHIPPSVMNIRAVHVTNAIFAMMESMGRVEPVIRTNTQRRKTGPALEV